MSAAMVPLATVRAAIDCEKCRAFVDLCAGDGPTDACVIDGTTADLSTSGYYRARGYFGPDERCAQCGRTYDVGQTGRNEYCTFRLDRPA